MKNRSGTIIAALALLALLTLNFQLSSAQAQGTAFTYQGQLQNNGSPASGTYNLTFTLFTFTNSTSGSTVAGPVTNNGVIVANGLFTVTVDFGSGLFTGTNYWLQIGVETNGASPFTTLTPVQQLTPVPYAIFAESSSNLLGTLPASRLTTSVGFENFFVGPSGNSTTTGSYNVASGDAALGADTIGSYNTADGTYALANNMSGYGNTANGYQALLQSMSGSFNTANGFGALYDNSYGSYNTADGAEALYQLGNGIAGGTNNVALGYQAGYNLNRNESSNIDIGNPGMAGENNTIRIGSSQSKTYIAGVINGNGAGLTNLNINASQLGITGNGNLFVGPSGNATTSGSDNTAVGVGALTNNTSGSENMANGFQALQGNASGSGNTANGYVTLSANTIGSDNTANGFYALANNTNGSDNTADGAVALLDDMSGSDNIALGYAAGDQITTGSSNIDIGNEGLSTDTNIMRIGSGQAATYIAGVINGNGAGLINVNVSAAQLTSIGNTNGGTGNFFVGPSGNSTTSGGGNTAIGSEALALNTTGSGNTADGANALQGALFGPPPGSDNTAIGFLALVEPSGSDNIALGYEAGMNISAGSSNIDIGNEGFSTDNNIIRIGSGQTATYIAGVINGNGGGLTNLNASQLTSVGNTNSIGFNFFVGPSGNSTMHNGYNTGIGFYALYSNSNGENNTADGAFTLEADTNGSDNTAVGTFALDVNTSHDNTAIGSEALDSLVGGSDNIALGIQAGSSFDGNESGNIDIGNNGNTGENNIIRIGTPGTQTATYLVGTVYANGGGLTNLNASQLFSIGNNNFFVGSAGNTANTGSDNTAMGAEALTNNTSGTGNTAFGFGALQSATGNFNFGYGYLAGSGLTTGGNNVDIAAAGQSSDNAIIRIGMPGIQTATYLAGNVYASGAVFSNGLDVVSDRNAKEDFNSINPQSVLAKVAGLPITEWNYKTTKNMEHIGPMAQDFHAAFGLNGTDDKHISVVDEGGVALAAIQGLNEKLEARSQKTDVRIQQLETQNADLKQQNDSLAERLDELEATVKQLAANK